MKKIIIAFTALAAAFSLASCNKEEIEAPSAELELNITVAGPDGSAGTKAAKTSWVTGDKVNMWFDNWNYAEKADNPVPDLIIKYNGASWSIDFQAPGLADRLKASGQFVAIYESCNDLTKYEHEWYNGNEWFKFKESRNPTTNYVRVCHAPMYLTTPQTGYTFADNKLTASIGAWNSTKFKVLIKNDDGKMNNTADNYYLQVKNTTTGKYASVTSAFTVGVGPNCPSLGGGSSNNFGISGGIQEADGIAFYFISVAADNADIEFCLLENGVDYFGDSNGYGLCYTATGKTVTVPGLTNIVIDHSKFAGEDNHESVDLGLSVKWATMNIGATSPEDCGDYFAWGETSKKTYYLWDREGDYKWGTYDGAAVPICGMTKYTSDVIGGDGLGTLLPEDDAATVNWGAKWHTPTFYEISELLDKSKCEWTWDDTKKGYTVKSLKTGNSIFLPTAGYFEGVNLSFFGMIGYYWSSSVREAQPSGAYDINISSFSAPGWYVDHRFGGRSVRPVRAE